MIGDLVFISYVKPNFIERSIKFFEGLDYPIQDEWEHVAICIDDNFNEIVEAVAGGVRINKFSCYQDQKVCVKTPCKENFTPDEKNKIVTVAKSYINTGYGYLDLVFLAARLSVEKFFSLPWNPTEPRIFAREKICSELAVNIIRSVREIFLEPKAARNISPAELFELVSNPS